MGKKYEPIVILVNRLNHSFFSHRTFFWYFQGVEKGCIGKEWVKFKFVISDALEADVKANKSANLKVRALSDKILFSGKFLNYSRTTSASKCSLTVGFFD